MKLREKIVILTGAGMSAESGISTFRDSGGLWEGHDVMEVASPMGWKKNPLLVIDFYNKRREQLKTVSPNIAHKSLVLLEAAYETVIITQNVDDLHERAGSSEVIHLHGELLKVRSVSNPGLVYDWKEDLALGDTCEKGSQLRPHIVWFGEEVPMLEPAISEIIDADIVIVIGTSMQVYPAASLVAFASDHSKIYYIDPKPSINNELGRVKNLEVISKMASDACPKLVEALMKRRGSQ